MEFYYSATADDLRQYFFYNPRTGAVIGQPSRPWGLGTSTRGAGERMGEVAPSGRFISWTTPGGGRARILRCDWVAWTLYYGTPPCGPLIHINGDMLDDRISNLREPADFM